jgi:hypothetical protein
VPRAWNVGRPKTDDRDRTVAVIPWATTAAATVAATRTATAAAAAHAATTAAAAAGARAILGFIHAQRTAAHVESVQGAHRALGVRLRHFDEAEAARPAGLAVGREGNGLDGAVLAKQFLDVLLRRSERQVAHVDLGHSNILRDNTSNRSQASLPGRHSNN